MKTQFHPPKFRPFWKSIELTHRFYQITGGYQFLLEGLKKLGIGIALFIALFIALQTWVFDFRALTESVTEQFSWGVVIVFQFLSEVITGVISPELFIVWAKSTPYPWLTLFSLATASYLGGVVSYLIGYHLHRFPRIHRWIDHRMAKQKDQLRRFGGLLIFLAALTPLPFPPVCTLAGAVGFKWRWFLKVALVRYLRFAIYAALLFGVYA